MFNIEQWLMHVVYDKKKKTFNEGYNQNGVDSIDALDTVSWTIPAITPERLVEMGVDPYYLMKFADANYLSGLRDDDYNFPELQNWLNFAETLAQKMVNDFENIKHKQFSKLHGFCIADTHNVIITHPFWNYSTHQSSEDTNILTKAIAEAGLENLYFIDTFNLFRRPGLCYGEIIKKIVNG
jgi:hypothetical protein